ncbi:isocitrate lyase/phosphoenolpyruvate mutase family protein [Streptomyces canus]|uniref:isocitrate lyase/PEP mutase family protein n=1 Tax=Streptomyces canus TaxID=58343 RepID=UPI002DD9C0C3|nr:isocitrate lyase/phosphoenolpyruvate mutase family protein [Streptomyces canus]WSD86490.1 isocitrate lyase/phosphoenolpyruvate mutase family protein [Streptomyces canus]
MRKVEVFRALHRSRLPGDPLVLPGPWDAISARVCEEAGFPALATPSAGIAAALGHKDGSTPADEMFAAVARISAVVEIPVSADLEGGYGLAAEELVERVLEAGAVGCNLEDSRQGVLKDPREHAEWLAEVRYAAGDQLFVNARVDTFSYGDGNPERAIERAALYVAAGADCVYPIGAPAGVLPLLRSGIQGPVNMFGRLDGEGPSPTELGELGATRVTFGPGLQRRMAQQLRESADGLQR